MAKYFNLLRTAFQERDQNSEFRMKDKHYGEIGIHSTIYEAVQVNSRSVQFSKNSSIQTEVPAVTCWDYFGEDRNTKAAVRRKEVLTERFDFNDCHVRYHGLYLSSVKETKHYLLSLHKQFLSGLLKYKSTLYRVKKLFLILHQQYKEPFN